MAVVMFVKLAPDPAAHDRLQDSDSQSSHCRQSPCMAARRQASLRAFAHENLLHTRQLKVLMMRRALLQHFLPVIKSAIISIVPLPPNESSLFSGRSAKNVSL